MGGWVDGRNGGWVGGVVPFLQVEFPRPKSREVGGRVLFEEEGEVERGQVFGVPAPSRAVEVGGWVGGWVSRRMVDGWVGGWLE